MVYLVSLLRVAMKYSHCSLNVFDFSLSQEHFPTQWGGGGGGGVLIFYKKEKI
jgi:hypothetical protein